MTSTKSDIVKAELLADYLSSVFTREPQEATPEEPTICYNCSWNVYSQPIKTGIKTKNI